MGLLTSIRARLPRTPEIRPDYLPIPELRSPKSMKWCCLPSPPPKPSPTVAAAEYAIAVYIALFRRCLCSRRRCLCSHRRWSRLFVAASETLAAGWPICRRCLCSPCRWSPLFVAGSATIAARWLVAVFVADRRCSPLVAVFVADRRWPGPLPPLPVQPPPLVAAVRRRVGNPRRWLARSAAAACAVPAAGRRYSSLARQPSQRGGWSPCSSLIAVIAALRRCQRTYKVWNASLEWPRVGISYELRAFELRRRRLSDPATPDREVDDEAVYLNVAGECPKRRVYGLGSLGRKRGDMRDPGASTSQMPEMVPRSEFDSVAEQLRHVVAFMQRQFGMTMDGAGLSQPQPPPPPPHEHQQPPQVDPPIHHNNRTMLSERCKIGLREMSSLVILRHGRRLEIHVDAQIRLGGHADLVDCSLVLESLSGRIRESGRSESSSRGGEIPINWRGGGNKIARRDPGPSNINGGNANMSNSDGGRGDLSTRAEEQHCPIQSILQRSNPTLKEQLKRWEPTLVFLRFS
ncbi:hypothetical protein Scep_023452 [Stephania cephalantha]|uniref:Uncharacterized protein n=1 Tax=Stephania cephalantha TaxID=152367 RepID=A0AAP0F042_9MAGN